MTRIAASFTIGALVGFVGALAWALWGTAKAIGGE